MISYKMHFIRTGTTRDNGAPYVTGQMDLPLSDAGREQLHQLKETFEYPKVQMVYSSPLSRCVETAEILFPDRQLVLEDNLMDMSLGEFEGQPTEMLMQNTNFLKWLEDSSKNPPPGGEAITDFAARTVTIIAEIFQEMMDQGLNEIAVVTHGGFIMTLLASIGIPRLPVDQWTTENGKGYTLLFTPQMWMRDNGAEVYSVVPQPKETFSDTYTTMDI